MDPHKMTQLANAEQKEMSMKSEGLHSSTTSTLAELLASFCEGKKEKKTCSLLIECSSLCLLHVTSTYS